MMKAIHNSNNINCVKSNNVVTILFQKIIKLALNTIQLLCVSCIIAYPILISMPWSKTIIQNELVYNIFPKDSKGGTTVVMLSLPILISGSISILLCHPLLSSSSSSRRSNANYSIVITRMKHLMKVLRNKLSFCNNNKYSSICKVICFIILPSAFYVVKSTYQKLLINNAYKSISISRRYSTFGNILAMVSIMTFSSWLFLPISTKHYGPTFLSSMFKDINYHIWAGRIIVLGGCVHGICYIIRYYIDGENILHFLIPPIGCFINNKSYKPTCTSTKSKCTCYNIMLNFTGLIAMIGLIIIYVSSLFKVRRNYYKLYIVTHYISSIIIIIFVCMHYNKSILYISGGLVYYLCMNVPIWINNLPYPYTSNNKPVDIVKIEDIDNEILCITLQVTDYAMKIYKPNDYVYIKIPTVSIISHPYTMNKTMINSESNNHNQMNIMLRTNGKFTSKLHTYLYQNEERKKIYITGFHSHNNLVKQIGDHDTCIIIATGIGITPYLTLISDMILSNNNDNEKKNITFYWLCRESKLIEYIQREYFNYWMKKCNTTTKNQNISINIVIYNTSSLSLSSSSLFSIDDNDNETINDNISSDDITDATSINIEKEEEITTKLSSKINNQTIPFTPTKLNEQNNSKLITFILFSIYTWLGVFVIYKSYLKYQTTTSNGYVVSIHTIIGRFYALLIFCIYTILFGLIVNFIYYLYYSIIYKHWKYYGTSITYQNVTHDDDDTHTTVDEYIEQKDNGNNVNINSISNNIDMMNGNNTIGINNGIALSPLCLSPEQQHDINKVLSIKKYYIGRPDISDLILSILNNDDYDDNVLTTETSYGLFCCVIPSVMNDINKCIQTEYDDVTVYEEAFLI